MPFGYVPDYRNRKDLISRLKDIYLRILGVPFYHRRVESRLVFRELSDVRDEKVLDVGCGDGLFVIELAKKGAMVCGVDIREEALRRAHKRVHELQLGSQAFLIMASATEIPFATGYFGCVICNCVLEHIPNDISALKEINRVLNADGLLVLTVPLDFETQEKVPLRLAKVLLRLPRKLKMAIGSRTLIEAESFYQYCNLFSTQRAQARFGYSLDNIEQKLKQYRLEVESVRRYIKMFGAIPIDLIDAFSCFGVEYGGEFGYVARHEWLFGLCFPIFYAISMLDSLLHPDAPALGMAIIARKVK